MLRKTLSLFFLFYTLTSFSQISEGGKPYSFTHRTNIQIQESQIPAPSASEIQAAVNTNKSKYCVGILKSVHLNAENAGTWVHYPDGSKSWFLKVTSPGAAALNFHYSTLYIPEGGELFLYNQNKNQIVGKFTSSRNTINPITHTQLVQGESTILEYHQPKDTKSEFQISISEVSYIFRGFEDFLSYFADPKGKSDPVRADYCQVDVACSPENNGWGEQIDAVVHFTFTELGYTYVCSASVVNNTAQDCTPYILTAWHCGEHTSNQNLSGVTWYWNYQKTSCQPNNNGVNPSKGNETMINGVVRATSGSGTLNNPPGNNQVSGSDFTLVELNSNIPNSYNAYYAGWDRSNTAPTNGVSIHHPAGSAKKISTYSSNLTSDTYNGGAYNAHWRVYWTSTLNGFGVTEGGSSGSPIFNQNKRIIGQLSGGSSSCSFTNYGDLYGKMSENWNNNGNNNGSQLAPWLDPTNSNPTFIDGTYAPCGSGTSLSCSANSSATSLNAGGNIDFYGIASSSNTSWSWNFDVYGLGGVSPSTSNTQNPTNISFGNQGTYEVQLTVTSGGMTCTSNLTITVNQNQTSGCPTMNNVANGQSLTIYPQGNGYISGWNNYADISKAEYFTISNPSYNTIKSISIYFYNVNSTSQNATIDFNIWGSNNGQPTSTILGSVSESLSTIESALSGTNYAGLYTVNFPTPITVSNGQFFGGITMNNFGNNDVLGIVTNYDNANSNNTAWEQWSNGLWYPYSSSSSWGYNLAHYIIAELTFIPTISPNQSICQGDNATLIASGAGSSGTYQWDNNMGSGSTIIVSPNATTTYTVNMLDANGCSVTTNTTVNVTPTPAVSASSSNATANINTSLDFFGTATNATQYLWDFDDGNSATTQNTSHAYTSTGAYQVTFTGSNGNCFDQDQIDITIINTNTGLNEYEGNEFILKPNPSNGNFTLEFNSAEDLPNFVKIFDINGKEIHHQNLLNRSSLQTIQVNMANGVYYVVTGKNKTNKLIIKK